ncbi:MAG: OmpA family protein [Micavibrio sp.]|nr:OmpA family protein [Micavibrio sp.]
MRIHPARLSLVTLSLAATLLVSACNTARGLKDDAEDNANWVNSKPSHLERSWGPVPAGYANQHNARDLILHPAPHGIDAKWKRDEKARALEAQAASGPVTNADNTVTVFPVDGAPAGDNMTPTYNAAAPADYGQLSQQLFFQHGSAKITAGDKARLNTFGQSIKDQPSASLTVVGHASTRVNTTDDEARRKEINFEIAQKRAAAVTGVLKNSGVEPGMVTAVSEGDEVPNQDPGSRDQESADRRVEVYMNNR